MGRHVRNRELIPPDLLSFPRPLIMCHWGQSSCFRCMGPQSSAQLRTGNRIAVPSSLFITTSPGGLLVEGTRTGFAADLYSLMASVWSAKPVRVPNAFTGASK